MIRILPQVFPENEVIKYFRIVNPLAKLVFGTSTNVNRNVKFTLVLRFYSVKYYECVIMTY